MEFSKESESVSSSSHFHDEQSYEELYDLFLELHDAYKKIGKEKKKLIKELTCSNEEKEILRKELESLGVENRNLVKMQNVEKNCKSLNDEILALEV